MYGLVNKSLQEMVEKKFGPTAWVSARTSAGIGEDIFISLDAYPDEMTYRLVGAVCEVTGMDAQTMLTDFGRYWVLETAAQHYGHLLHASGRTFRDFLLALPNFHARVSLMMPRLVPPEFACEETAGDRLVLHYRSSRAGLVPFVEGLIQGLAELYSVAAATHILDERSDGPGHTVFEVIWQNRALG
jgi:hypothetical protein